MRLIDKMKHKLKCWLEIENPQSNIITMQNLNDFETEAYVNKVWSWSDRAAIEQMAKQANTASVSGGMNFWCSVPSLGLVKKHTGLPAIILQCLVNVVISDMNDLKLKKREDDWNNIISKEKFKELVEQATKETLVVGDGAFKISVDTDMSKYPLVEYVSGEKIEFVYVRGILKDIIFKSTITHNSKRYVMEEVYGYGYIYTRLYDDGREVPLSIIPALSSIPPKVTYDDNYIMAVPIKFIESLRFEKRGQSIYHGKNDSFDSLDETWSQWMHALRKGQTKEYIPESILPRDPKTGQIMNRNDFDNVFIAVEKSRGENDQNKIQVSQPAIPHESYLSTYITALDLCLQGIISPSTIGIDTKKMDNAEAQREKEKTTLYTRNKVVTALQTSIPELVKTMLKVFDTMNMKAVSNEDIEVELPFGEYANPSFESQVETVAKAKSGGIMSVEASVDELYGASKDDKWKATEVARLKAEQGIAVMEEPAVADVNTEVL